MAITDIIIILRSAQINLTLNPPTAATDDENVREFIKCNNLTLIQNGSSRSMRVNAAFNVYFSKPLDLNVYLNSKGEQYLDR